MTRREFSAVIQGNDTGGAWVDVPFDVEQVFGRKRVPVRALIEGVEYRGSLVRMGGPGHMLLMRKDIREQVGRQPGDEVHVVVEEDTEPRVVEVPGDFRRALGTNASAREYFDGLAYSHQREYVNWITEAKRDATRVARIEKAVVMLEQNRKVR
jgi:hypothetical protein